MRHAVPVVLGFLVVACGSSGSSPTSGALAPAATDADDAGAECMPAPGGADSSARAYCVREVTGRLQDPSAKPLANVAVSICGRACFSDETDATGAFHVRVNTRLPEGGYVFFAHARPRHGSVLLPLPSTPAERIDLGPVIELPVLSEESGLVPEDEAPESSVRVGPLTIGVAAGTKWQLAFEDLADEVDGRRLRFAKVPVERAPSFAAGATLVYALAPFDAKPSKPVSLTLSDTGGLAAGTAVDILVMGSLGFDAPNAGGKPQLAAKGHVSADGKSIATDPGEGLPNLTWVVIRPAAKESM